MTKRQQLFIKLVRENEAWHNARKERLEVQCPNCGVAGFNSKTGVCSKPWQCCGEL